jgi:hypothetical protein
MYGMVAHTHDFYRVPLVWTPMAKVYAWICQLAIISRLTTWSKISW